VAATKSAEWQQPNLLGTWGIGDVVAAWCCCGVQGGSEKLSDEAIDETLDKVVKLLAYISDKDLFAEFYRKRLARRLLQDKSASDDHERSILTRLKQQCGAQVRFAF
jgi:hypothetical protein